MGTGTTQHRADNRRRDGDPPLGRSGRPRATATSPPATGSRTERRSAGRPARRSRTQAGQAIRSAPNPGTSWRGALGV